MSKTVRMSKVANIADNMEMKAGALIAAVGVLAAVSDAQMETVSGEVRWLQKINESLKLPITKHQY